jgi:hypothetical protein
MKLAEPTKLRRKSGIWGTLVRVTDMSQKILLCLPGPWPAPDPAGSLNAQDAERHFIPSLCGILKAKEGV